MRTINITLNGNVNLYRQLALKRLRRTLRFLLWRLPWTTLNVTLELLSPSEVVMHEEPGKKPLGRHEWDKHYHNSPKIF